MVVRGFRTATAVVFVAIAVVLGSCGVDGADRTASGPDAPSSAGSEAATGSDEGEPVDAADGAAGSGESGPDSSLREAAEATLGATSYRMEGTSIVAVNGSVGAEVRLSGEFDAESEREHVRMEIEADMGGGMLDAMTLESIRDGDTVYYKGPPMFGGRGDSWTVESADGLAPTRSSVPVQNANGLFVFLEAADSEVEELGTEEIRGVPTTHMRTVLDIAGALDAQPSERMEAMMRDWLAVMEMQTKGPFTELPVDIWIDGDGFIRRTAYDIVLEAGTGETVVDFFDFGEPVEIEIPDESEVREVDPADPDDVDVSDLTDMIESFMPEDGEFDVSDLEEMFGS